MKRGFILQNRKLKIPSEVVYILAVALLSLAVAMLTAANFGVSMIVAPAYLLSLKVGILTFGQAEYVIQAGLFIIFCIVMRGFRAVYLSSFVTCLIYGAALDLWRCIPFFNPNVTTPGSMSMPIRILLFIFGVLLTSFSVAMFYKTYLYPQVYDFFVKGVSGKFGIKLSRFKTCFDLSCLAVAAIMSLAFFGRFEGIGWGTLVIAPINGTIIGFFCRLFDKYFDFPPLFKNSPLILSSGKSSDIFSRRGVFFTKSLIFPLDCTPRRVHYTFDEIKLIHGRRHKMSTFPDVKKNFGFGCMRLPMDGEKVDYAEFTKMVDEFMAQGFNYFDTARVYIGGQGETAIRDCVVKRYPRDSFILTDKLSDSLFNSEDEIRPLFEKQLESCGVDYFDFYLLHSQTKSIFENTRSCTPMSTRSS